MADEDKSEDPTGKRLDEARKQGNVGKSADLIQAATLLFGTLALWKAGGWTVEVLRRTMIECFRAIPNWRPDDAGMASWLSHGILHVLKLVAPVSAAAVLVSVILGIAMAGMMFNLEALAPKFGKIFDPANFARLVSARTWVEILKSTLRMFLVALVGFQLAWSHREEFLVLPGLAFPDQALFAARLAHDALVRMGLFLLVLGFADLWWKKHSRKQDLMMSKHEVKDEARQSEGDPKVKGKIKGLRMAMHRKFMMRDVPKATVVVTNPTHFAVALRYRRGEDRAPVVVAKGADHMAARIRAIAREHGVPLVENPPLARALHARAEPGEAIPDDLFAAVAELLAMVMRMPAAKPRVLAAGFLPFLPLLLLPLLGGCDGIFASPDTSPSARLAVSDPTGFYRGGNLVVDASVENCGEDGDGLVWRTGRAVLVSRGQVLDARGTVARDTVVLRWDARPDSDTAGISRDTVALSCDGVELARKVLVVTNILPVLDSVQAGASLDSSALRTLPVRGDTLVVATRPGESIYLRLRLHDPDANYPWRLECDLPVETTGGGELGWRGADAADSVLVWRAPSELLDTVLSCKLRDGLGGGGRGLHLRLSTYEEKGSVWAGVHTGLVKFGLTKGDRLVEVARLAGFQDVAALDIDPSREGGILLAADHVAGALRKFTSEGVVRSISASVVRPRAVACDADAAFCWVGDADSTGTGGRLLRADGGALAFTGLPAGVTSLAVDQGGVARAWFASRDSGYLGRTSAGVLDTLLRGRYVRVTGLAFDDGTRTVWVLDGTAGTLSRVDSTGAETLRLTGLSAPGGIAAGGGRVWVAETGAGTVREYAAATGALLANVTGFSGPSAVAVLAGSPDRAWVADTENGRLVLLEGGTVLAATAGQGLTRPDVLAVHRGAP